MEIRYIFVWVIIAAMLFSCNGTNENEQQSLLEISKQELVTALAERDRLLTFVKDVSAGLKHYKIYLTLVPLTNRCKCLFYIADPIV